MSIFIYKISPPDVDRAGWVVGDTFLEASVPSPPQIGSDPGPQCGIALSGSIGYVIFLVGLATFVLPEM